jgi:hypothetical protein
MRKRAEIEKDGTRVDMLCLEVLLDIRELLLKDKPKRGRPRKECVK